MSVTEQNSNGFLRPYLKNEKKNLKISRLSGDNPLQMPNLCVLLSNSMNTNENERSVESRS